jgi:hypothetical protein
MYIVLKAANIEDLVSQVNEYLKNGWVCAGGICCHPTFTATFFQAMVK